MSKRSLEDTIQAAGGIWGEEGGGSAKPNVERHKQMEIRATVGPNPYATNARDVYRK